MADKNTPNLPSGGRHILCVILLSVVGFAIYHPALSSTFHFDDRINIMNNPAIKDLSTFLHPGGNRYIAYLSFAIDYLLHGLDPFGYHLTNIIIHILNATCVYILVNLTFMTPALREWLQRTTPSPTAIALTSALLFLSHPVQTQAVTYISQRFTSLATLFYLLSLISYIKARSANAVIKPLYILSILSAILAMKTKEISLTLPFTVLLYEYTFIARGFKRGLIHSIPFFLLLPMIPLELLTGDGDGDVWERMRTQQIRDLQTLPWNVYLVTQIRVIVTYLRLLIFPAWQNLDYDYPIFTSVLDMEVLLSLILISSLLVLGIYIFRRARRKGDGYGILVFWGIAWFFITLSVESLVPIQDVINEHRLYLPSVGMVVAFCGVLNHGLQRAGLTTFWQGLVVALLVFILGVTAWKRNLVWKDELTLWSDVVAKSPHKARGYNNLGLAYADRGRMDDAIEAFRRAIELEPDHARAHNNLGLAYYRKGRRDRALSEYTLALRLDPELPEAHFNLANLYLATGRIDEAIEEYRTALRLKPAYPKAHNNLGNAYARAGRLDDAIEEYKKALSLDKDLAEARYNLELLRTRKGLTDTGD